MTKFLSEDDIQFALAFQSKKNCTKISNFLDDAGSIFVNFISTGNAVNTLYGINNYGREVLSSHPNFFFHTPSNQHLYWNAFPKKFHNALPIDEGTVFLINSFANLGSNRHTKGSQFLNYMFQKYPEHKVSICEAIVNSDFDKFNLEFAIPLLTTLSQDKNLKLNKGTVPAPSWLKGLTQKINAFCTIQGKPIKFETLGSNTWKALSCFQTEDSKVILQDLFKASNENLKILQFINKENENIFNFKQGTDLFTIAEEESKNIEIIIKNNISYRATILQLTPDRDFNASKISTYIKDYVQAYTAKYELANKNDYLTTDSKNKIQYANNFRSVKDGEIEITHKISILITDTNESEENLQEKGRAFIGKMQDSVKQRLQNYIEIISMPGASEIVNRECKNGSSAVLTHLEENKAVRDLKSKIEQVFDNTNENPPESTSSFKL